MKSDSAQAIRPRRGASLGALCLLLAQAGCSIGHPSVPNLFGPSTLGLNISMTATPDLITADNVSKSVVRILVRGPNGQPEPGIPMGIAVFEGPSIVNLGTLSATSGTTDGNGYVVVTYTAPARTDVDNQILINIGARALQGDANGSSYHFVSIELRPAEPSQFPQVPGTTPLNCSFAIEPAVPGSFSPGLQILFQDTSSDPNTNGKIIRYQWNFGDGSVGQGPDVNHAYAFVGFYTVTDVVTDNLGVSSSCSKVIDVEVSPLATSAGRR
jgi:hypothetical protein